MIKYFYFCNFEGRNQIFKKNLYAEIVMNYHNSVYSLLVKKKGTVAHVDIYVLIIFLSAS